MGVEPNQFLEDREGTKKCTKAFGRLDHRFLTSTSPSFCRLNEDSGKGK